MSLELTRGVSEGRGRSRAAFEAGGLAHYSTTPAPTCKHSVTPTAPARALPASRPGGLSQRFPGATFLPPKYAITVATACEVALFNVN